MGSLSHLVSFIALKDHPASSQIHPSLAAASFSCLRMRPLCSSSTRRYRRHLSLSVPENDSSEALVQDLRVPDAWLIPSTALQESEWLRVALHEWLDAEYCPEDANIEISKVAARSYYESLMAKEGDLGEILLKMAGDLERLSFQESFHGPFSSANAAILLITRRIDSELDPSVITGYIGNLYDVQTILELYD